MQYIVGIDLVKFCCCKLVMLGPKQNVLVFRLTVDKNAVRVVRDCFFFFFFCFFFFFFFFFLFLLYRIILQLPACSYWPKDTFWIAETITKTRL